MPARVKSTGLTVDKQVSSPPTPATGEAVIYVKSDGRVYSKDDTGTERPNGTGLLASPIDRNFWIARAAAAIVEGVGIANPTSAPVPTVSNDSDSTYVNYASSVTINSVAGFSTPFNLVRRQYNPVFETILRTGADVSSIKIIVGLLSALPLAAGIDALGATSGVGIRFSTATSDAGWLGVASSGAGQSVTGSLGAVAASSRYLLRIRVDNTSGIAYFSVNNGAELSLNTNLPAAATELGLVVRMSNTVALNRDLKFSRSLCSFD